MKKILCVFGTRPEAVKMAPVVREIQKRKNQFALRICVTAQHRSMLDDVLKIFHMAPDYDLNIMKAAQSLEHITELVIHKIAPVLRREKPDLVLVHGDTSTTFLTALACFYQRIPVGHVEAGLRSYDFDNPFPEEANRRLTDDLCTLHFAATPTGRKNLLAENIRPEGIYVTGNTVIDALKWAVLQPHVFESKPLRDFFGPIMSSSDAQVILVTAHRRENFGKPMEDVCRALKRTADRFKDVRIIYPVHLNPNVQVPVKRILGGHPRVLLLPPLHYLDFACLLERSTFVVTDSGGLQEEAPSLGKPVLVLRKVTERPEAVAACTAKIIGTEAARVEREIARLLTEDSLYTKMANAVNPYGDGKAAARTVDAIQHYFGRGPRPKDFISG
ncbi:MAG: UDP-N-acetylglucosamine 2-epimerase [Elusimicrobia bacterium RIFCSPLOWO2_01_FULL_54_10]|nr:MAG: UDP-N-acetylglucosamine 2-epimerase [Elusimicrobia bacterium RIFCSPLOWO2_01_FULL_54_10]